MIQTRQPAPTLGIVAQTSGNPNRLFGGQDTMFKETLRLHSSSLKNLRIVGLALNQEPVEERIYELQTENWREINEPAPLFVYDRVFPLDRQQRTRYRTWLAQASNRGVRFVNHPDLPSFTSDKLRCFVWFQQLDIRTPPTIGVKGWSELEAFLQSHGSIVIKPRRGSGGRGLYRLKANDSQWTIDGALPKISGLSLDSVRAVLDFSYQKPEETEAEWVGQQYVTGDNVRAVELRLLVQRSCFTRLPSVQVLGRVAAANCWTTNLARGALAYPPLDTLRRFRNLSRHAALKKLQHLVKQARYLHQELESRYFPIGELVVDFLLDRDAEPWLMELNSKPGKIGFTRLAISPEMSLKVRERYAAIRKRVLIRPLQFLWSLAESSP